MISKIYKILSKFLFIFICLIIIINTLQILKPNTVQADYYLTNIRDSGILINSKVDSSYSYGTMFFTDQTQIIGYISTNDGEYDLCKKTDGIMKVSGNLQDIAYEDMQKKNVPKYYYEEQEFGQMYNNNTGDNNDYFTGAKKRVLSNYMPPYNSTGNKIYVYGLKYNQKLKLKITNCAIDKDGDLCDVVCEMGVNTSINGRNGYEYPDSEEEYKYGYIPYNNWLGRDALHVLGQEEYDNYAYGSSGLKLNTYHRWNYYSQYLRENREKNGGKGVGEENFNLKAVELKEIPRALITVTNDNGLVSFSFNTNLAKGTMSFKYYKKGTSNKANLDKICSVIDDIDVIAGTSGAEANGQDYKSVALDYFGYNGNEAVTIKNGGFYNFDNASYDDQALWMSENRKTVYRYRWVSGVSNNGIYDIVPSKKYSVLMVQNVNDSGGKFEFSYQAAGCGIGWKFLVPYEIDTPNPIKKINGNTNDSNSPYRVYEGQEFTYTISQYIPNNYFIYNNTSYGDYISSFYGITNKVVSSVTIEDQLNSKLDCYNFVIKNERGQTKTSDFNIQYNNGKLTISPKTGMLAKMDFYNHTYTITIKAKVKNGAGKSMTGPISNQAILRLKYTNNGVTNKTSNTVYVDTKYNLNVHIIVKKTDEYGNEINDGSIPTSTELAMNENKIESNKNPNSSGEKYYRYVYKRGQSVTTIAMWHPQSGYGVDKISINNYTFNVYSNNKWNEYDKSTISQEYHEANLPYIQETQKKSFNDIMNQNIGHEIIIESSQLVNILGNVWQDGDNDNLLTNSNNKDKMVNGINVKLITNDDNEISTTKTSNGGQYSFNNLSRRKLYEKNFKIKFEYDGFTWDAVEPITNNKYGSKAYENNIYRGKLNSAFSTVTGQNQVIDYRGNKTLTYSKFDDGTVKLNNACDKEQQGQIINVNQYGNLNIDADTKENYLYNLYKNNNYPINISNINLGLREREQTDLELKTDIYLTDLHMNNSHDVQNYEKKIYLNNGMLDKHNESEWNNYKIEIDEGDLNDCNVHAGDVGEASIRVLYKIALANNSNKFVKINSIKNVVDSDLKATGKVLIRHSEVESLSKLDGVTLNNDSISFNNGVRLNPDNIKYVYIEYQMKNTPENRQIIKNRTLNEKAEITSYSVFSDNKFSEPYACIDTDSIPNNNDDTEDDTDGIGIKIETYEHRVKEINGKVFYDIDNMNDDNGYKIRQGDGKYTTNEKGIKDVKVNINREIVNIDNTNNTGDYSFEIPIYDKDGKITHGENDEPEDYILQFTWGINNGGYDVKDYKGTNVVQSDYGYKYWYTKNNDRPSDAIDDWNLRNDMDIGKSDNNSNLTEMISTTNKFPIWNKEYKEYPEIQDGKIKMVSLPYWTKNPINNIDFGITRRPKQSMEVEKKATNLTIRDASGRILVNATVNDDGSLSGQIAGVTGGPKYVKGSEYLGYIKAEIDNEALDGSTAEVTYKIIVTNTSELDYEDETYYLYRNNNNGEYRGVIIPNNDDDIIKLQPVNIYDYLDKDLTGKIESTSWTQMTQEEVKSEIKDKITLTEEYFISSIKENIKEEKLPNITSFAYDIITIDGKIYKGGTDTIPKGTTIIEGLKEINSEEMKKYYTKWYSESKTQKTETTIKNTINKIKLDDNLVYKINEEPIPSKSKNNKKDSKANIIEEEFIASSLLANTNEIRFDNKVEVSDIYVTTGTNNQTLEGVKIEMKLTQLYDESEWISITPPTGENRDYVMIVMVSLSSIIILGAGIVFIKKKVLK